MSAASPHALRRGVQYLPAFLRASPFNTIRSARSHTSDVYFFVVFFMMLHPTLELEPPANPARFNPTNLSIVSKVAFQGWITPRIIFI